MSKIHYQGLTDAQVLESRAKYGANVLTPPEEDSLWDQIKEVCKHPIAITMFILVGLKKDLMPTEPYRCGEVAHSAGRSFTLYVNPAYPLPQLQITRTRDDSW